MILGADVAADLESVPGAIVGVGPEVSLADAARSAAFAEAALGFSVVRGQAVDVARYDSIGPICLLGLENNPLVRRDAFIETVHGVLDRDPSLIPVFEALCAQGTVRGAAKVLRLHHSSVSARIQRAETAAGLDLRDPSHTFSLQLALATWRS